MLKRLHQSGWLDCVKQWLCISDFLRKTIAQAGVPEERLFTLRHSWPTRLDPDERIDEGYYLFLGHDWSR